MTVLPNPFDFTSANSSAERPQRIEETPVSVAVAELNSELARQANVVSLTALDSPATRLLGTGQESQASSPESAEDAPSGQLGWQARDTASPAVFIPDARLQGVMLALADELADEQRTQNEKILLEQFAPPLFLRKPMALRTLLEIAEQS